MLFIRWLWLCLNRRRVNSCLSNPFDLGLPEIDKGSPLIALINGWSRPVKIVARRVNAINLAFAEVRAKHPAQRDYLAELHQLSEFAPYESAPTSRNDEPLFARGQWKRVVEHKVFGVGTPLYRKQLDNGSFAVVVKYGGIERVLAMDAGLWITPIETIEKVKILKVDEFKFRDGSPSKRDRPWGGLFSSCQKCGKEFESPIGFAFCGERELTQGDCKKAWLSKHHLTCERRKPAPRFHEVTEEDVDWATRPSLNKRKVTAKKQNDIWCAKCGEYVEQDHIFEQDHKSSNYETAKPLIHQAPKSAYTSQYSSQEQFERVLFMPTRLLEPSVLAAVADSIREDDGNSVNTLGHPANVRAVDRCSKDHRADLLHHSRRTRSERYVGNMKLICERCGISFWNRKGTKYCGEENCAKKETNKCQQQPMEYQHYQQEQSL